MFTKIFKIDFGTEVEIKALKTANSELVNEDYELVYINIWNKNIKTIFVLSLCSYGPLTIRFEQFEEITLGDERVSNSCQ